MRGRSRTVHETRSAASGRIRVVDYRRERRLVVGGEILSVLPLDGDWRTVRREYWWQALKAVRLPAHPSVLLVGLGGGTQVHLLHQLTRPRLITVIERDPVILRVAREWFGLGRVGPLEIACAEASQVVADMARLQRQFDFIMEDAAYGDDEARSLPLARALAGRVAPGGALVVNRHWRGDARVVADILRPLFEQLRLRRVRREGENVLVCGLRPRTCPDSA